MGGINNMIAGDTGTWVIILNALVTNGIYVASNPVKIMNACITNPWGLSRTVMTTYLVYFPTYSCDVHPDMEAALEADREAHRLIDARAAEALQDQINLADDMVKSLRKAVHTACNKDYNQWWDDHATRMNP